MYPENRRDPIKTDDAAAIQIANIFFQSTWINDILQKARFLSNIAFKLCETFPKKITDEL